MEKKDEEVGLDSRLLKKDSNRFIEPLMCATGCTRGKGSAQCGDRNRVLGHSTTACAHKGTAFLKSR